MDNQVTNSLGGNVFGKDVRISNPALRIHPDFHYPANCTSGRIACFMPGRKAANYCVNNSQTINIGRLSDCC